MRHAADCKYAGDEFCERSNCRKHFRWTQGGKQFRRTAGTRSWGEAEDNKAHLADQLPGRQPERATGQLLIDAIKTFAANKEAQGVNPRVRSMYARELKRLREFSERQGLVTVAQALTMENLIAHRSTWSVEPAPKP